MTQPRIFIFDIETSPLVSYTWGTHDQNISLNQIKDDWHILAWAGKWLGEPASKTIYMDNRHSKFPENDIYLVQCLAACLEEADIVITQNGDRFDIKKLNARAAIWGLPPIKACRSTDTLKESRKVFAFTSHKLEYMTEKLNKKYKKLKHEKYPGFELWKAIMNGDKKAWKEMQKYCIHDVLATEELYQNIQGWIKTQNMAAYVDDNAIRCTCGSTRVYKKGFIYTDGGKYQGYKCKDCGKRPKGRFNLLSYEKKQSLLRERKS